MDKFRIGRLHRDAKLLLTLPGHGLTGRFVFIYMAAAGKVPATVHIAGVLPQVQQHLLPVGPLPQQNGKYSGIETVMLRSCHTTAPLPDVHPLHGGAEPCGAVQREHGALQLAGTVGVAVAPRQAA